MIYVAVADLIPGLHRRPELRATVSQTRADRPGHRFIALGAGPCSGACISDFVRCKMPGLAASKVPSLQAASACSLVSRHPPGKSRTPRSLMASLMQDSARFAALQSSYVVRSRRSSGQRCWAQPAGSRPSRPSRATGASRRRNGATTRISPTSSSPTCSRRGFLDGARRGGGARRQVEAAAALRGQAMVRCHVAGEFRRHQSRGAASRRSSRNGESLTRGLANLIGDTQQRPHQPDRRVGLRGRPQPRRHAGRRGLRERADPADPVRAADAAGARAAAAHGAALHQQVLHPRPAAGELVRALRGRAGPHGVHGLLAQRRPARLGAASTWDDYLEQGVLKALARRAARSPAADTRQRARLLRRRHAARRGARGAARRGASSASRA